MVCGRAGKQPPGDPPQQGVIVADQRRAAVDQPQSEVGLAAAGAAADQHRAAADRDAAGVDGLGRKNRRCSWRGSRKADDEAGAGAPVVPILDFDATAVPLDDRPGDGEAEAGMVAEILASGLMLSEAVKDRFPRFRVELRVPRPRR